MNTPPGRDVTSSDEHIHYPCSVGGKKHATRLEKASAHERQPSPPH